LSLLVLSQRVRKGRGDDENKRKKYLELELAVVNNGRSDVPELSLLVEFVEQALLGLDAAAVLRGPAAAGASAQVERGGAGRGVRGA
jgi:hypothetical protein